MNFSQLLSLLLDPKCRRSCRCSLLAAALLCLVFFIVSALIVPELKENLSRWVMLDRMNNSEFNDCNITNSEIRECQNQCRPYGSEALPRGIVSATSNLEMRPLWGFPQENVSSSLSLFTAAVGIRQKDLVNDMVRKFLASNFTVMLFHYDGIVDEWRTFEWSKHVIHVSAVNQTKWWFAKRFLHPDIVAEYSYIFLWDEDIGVEDFHPERYLSIIRDEGLEISQPALDPGKSEMHHQITVRGRRSDVHRRTYKAGGKGCDWNNTSPPCTGWIEVMAPVFSRAAWRCVWYMVQNDLIHAWGLDIQIGYCAQGDRTKNVGVVDAEYIVHHGLPTLGGANEKAHQPNEVHIVENESTKSTEAAGAPRPIDDRLSVRRQAYIELDMFKRRWGRAAAEDKCWSDPYQANQD